MQTFNLKQFHILQDSTIFKVNTDAVLLGAWANPSFCTHGLDIGTATGILALMTAQRNPNINILAIDINPNVKTIAESNFVNSPFSDRLAYQHISVQELFKNTSNKFDFIISNPPFYKDSLLSPNKVTTQSKHCTDLTFDDLFSSVSNLLTSKGIFSLIVPFQYLSDIITLGTAYNLFFHRQQLISPFIDTPPNRVLLSFSKSHCTPLFMDNLAIRDKLTNSYTPSYINLTKDYYINF